jgi:hypothetical protein
MDSIALEVSGLFLSPKLEISAFGLSIVNLSRYLGVSAIKVPAERSNFPRRVDVGLFLWSLIWLSDTFKTTEF